MSFEYGVTVLLCDLTFIELGTKIFILLLVTVTSYSLLSLVTVTLVLVCTSNDVTSNDLVLYISK
jgi:hypothetical protein